MKTHGNLHIPFLVSWLLATSVSAATVDGIHLHSSVSGKGPRTVILVHGWTCDDRTWKPQEAAGRVLSAVKQYGESLKAREAMVQAMFTASTTAEVRRQVLSMIPGTPAATPLAAMEAFADQAVWKDAACDEEDVVSRIGQVLCVASLYAASMVG